MARVKICGLKTAETMAAALDAGAAMVGLVFFAPSPRNVDLATAAALADQARGRARIVALLVDADDDLIARIVAQVRPDLLQLHGNETPARVGEVRRRFAVPVMKAIKVATADDAASAVAYRGIADLILFDAKPPKGADRPGGHGAKFDWSVIEAVGADADFVLSGGLTPENVGAAIRATGATAVDVSSGVESATGVKDARLIAAFVAAAHAIP